jgi:hypothetical protein
VSQIIENKNEPILQKENKKSENVTIETKGE